MSDYRIFGSELSPYSVKVRSYFRYKGLPHEWLLRSPANQPEFQKYAKLPLVPLVVTPDEEGVQDSTPIIERFEKASPSLQPDDPTLAFLSALLEEYGDEWGNKWMFHYRWRYQPDAWSTAERIAQQMMGAVSPRELHRSILIRLSPPCAPAHNFGHQLLTALTVWPNVRWRMIPLFGSLAMGVFSGVIFWATISLGGTPRSKPR